MNSLTGLFCSHKSFTLQSGKTRKRLFAGELLPLHRLSVIGEKKILGLLFGTYEHHEQNLALPLGP